MPIPTSLHRESILPCMNQTVGKSGRSGKLTLGRAVLILVAVELVLLGIGFGLGQLLGVGVSWTLLSWAICGLAALLALVASCFPRGVEFAMLRLAGGVVCRTVLPMGLVLWGFKLREPPVGPADVLVLVLFYLVGLVADSVLSVQLLQKSGPDGSGTVN